MNRFAKNSSTVTRIVAIVLAMVANSIVILVARGIFGHWPRAVVGGNEQVVMVGAVIGATLVAGIGAWIVALAIERLAGRPARTWVIVGTVFWGISLLSLTGAQNASSAITLGLLHTITAALLIAGMLRTLPEHRA